MRVTDARTSVLAVLKRSGAKSRRGHLRIQVGDLWWYVDLRAEGPGPEAPLLAEVGCWLPALPPEPDGGAVDCPLLVDWPLGEDPVEAAERLVDLVTGIGDLPTLAARLDDLPGALVDRPLRDLMA